MDALEVGAKRPGGNAFITVGAGYFMFELVPECGACACHLAEICTIGEVGGDESTVAEHHLCFVKIGLQAHLAEQLDEEVECLLEPVQVSGQDQGVVRV